MDRLLSLSLSLAFLKEFSRILVLSDLLLARNKSKCVMAVYLGLKSCAIFSN